MTVCWIASDSNSNLQHTAGSDTIFIQIYIDAPPGVTGVSKTFLQIKLLNSCAKIALKRHKLQKSSKFKKSKKKNLFLQTFLNILQFGGNLSAPNLNWHVQQILAHLLTPLGPLGARQQWRYMSFKIFFDYFVTMAPPGGFFSLFSN